MSDCALLFKKDSLPLCRNVGPVDGIEVPFFLVVTKVPTPALGVLLDFQLGLRTDSGLVGVWANNDIFPVDHSRPRELGAAASETFHASATLRLPADLGGVVAVLA